MVLIQINLSKKGDIAAKKFMLRKGFIRKSEAINRIVEESDLSGLFKN
jgi:hypothetical protein